MLISAEVLGSVVFLKKHLTEEERGMGEGGRAELTLKEMDSAVSPIRGVTECRKKRENVTKK